MQDLANTNIRPIAGVAARFFMAALALLLASCATGGSSDGFFGLLDAQSKPYTSANDLQRARNSVAGYAAEGFSGSAPQAAANAAFRIAVTFDEGQVVENNNVYAYAWYDMAANLHARPSYGIIVMADGNQLWVRHSEERRQKVRIKMPYDEYEKAVALVKICYDTDFQRCPGDEVMR